MLERTDEEIRRRKILIALQVLRFVVAVVMLLLAIYFGDMLLGVLAVAFLVLGTFTTWLRLRQERENE